MFLTLSHQFLFYLAKMSSILTEKSGNIVFKIEDLSGGGGRSNLALLPLSIRK